MFNFFRKKTNAKLFYSTDVHCHILPGVDHGAKDLNNAIELIKAQMDMGINQIILTPHITKSTFENNPDTIKAAYEVFCKAMENLFTIGVTLKRATIMKMILPIKSVFVSKSIKAFPFNPKRPLITTGMYLKSEKRKRIQPKNTTIRR